VAYFGPPDEALPFFGVNRWSEVFDMLDNNRDFDWPAATAPPSTTPCTRRGGVRGAAPGAAAAGPGAAVPGMPPGMAPPGMPHPGCRRRPRRGPAPVQLGFDMSTLCRRYMQVIIPTGLPRLSVALPDAARHPDPRGAEQETASICADPAATRGASRSSTRTPSPDDDPHPRACFTGAANSVLSDQERVIYERERRTGLSRSAYMMSKVIVLGLITAIQAVIIAFIGFTVRDLPDKGLILSSSSPFLEMTFTLIVLAFTSMMVGLLISSLVRAAR